MPNTSSPGAKRVTPRPVASTVPETSQPTTNGGSPSTPLMPLPARVLKSTGFTPAACTRTSTSVGRGSGRGRWTGSRTPGPPKRETWTARISPRPQGADVVAGDGAPAAEPLGEVDPARARHVGERAGAHDRVVQA